MGKKKTRGKAKVRTQPQLKERLVRRLDVELEKYSRTCNCKPWQPHQIDCPKAVEQSQPGSSRAETCLDDRADKDKNRTVATGTRTTATGTEKEQNESIGVVDCKFTYASDINRLSAVKPKNDDQKRQSTVDSCIAQDQGKKVIKHAGKKELSRGSAKSGRSWQLSSSSSSDTSSAPDCD